MAPARSQDGPLVNKLKNIWAGRAMTRGEVWKRLKAYFGAREITVATKDVDKIRSILATLLADKFCNAG